MWLWDGLANALRMAWEVWWALVLGFALSGIVQAWVPRERLRTALGGRGAREAALATGLGAASSSCSYAAIAIEIGRASCRVRELILLVREGFYEDVKFHRVISDFMIRGGYLTDLGRVG